MLYAEHIIQDSMNRLKTINKTLKTDAPVDEITKSRIYGICFNLILAFEEEYFAFKNYDFKEYNQKIEEALTVIDNEKENAEEIKNKINMIINLIPEDYDYKYKNVSDFDSYSYRLITRNEDVHEHNLKRMGALIHSTDRTINILDPKCGEGKSLNTIGKRIKGAVTYGIETESYVADRAKENLNKVAKGKLLGSRISNEAFDVMYLNLPISWDISAATTRVVKNEKKYIQDTYKYVRPGGVIIYVLPFFRLYKDICVLIAKYINNIQVVKLEGPDFDEKNLIAIIGEKKQNRQLDDDSYKLLRRARNIKQFKSIMDGELKTYTLPSTAIEIETFRGSVLDFDEMETLVENSGCLDEFWDSQKVEKLSENTKQPLLPFNIGQIGLVLTSGCLDGIVDEGNGNFHVIKGRVSKKSDIERNIVDGRIEVHETVSNRVEINVVLPNGEYKVLA